MEKGMKLQLYRTLLRKAKRATSGSHLFRFQDDCTSSMWGLYTMHNPETDRQLLQRIFPISAHPFIDNSFKFDDNSIYRRSYIHQQSQNDLLTENPSQQPPIIKKQLQNNETNTNIKDPLFNKYYPNLQTSKQNLDTLKDPSENENENENETKKKKQKSKEKKIERLVDFNLTSKDNESNIPLQIYPTPLSSSLSNYIVVEYDKKRLNTLIYNVFKHYSDLNNIKKIEKKTKNTKNKNTNIENNNNNNNNIEYYEQPTVTETSLIKDAFNTLTELDRQIEINECTSIAEASGIRIIVTSKHCPDVVHSDKKKPYAFTYRIRIENHGHEWVQLIGRHWIIEDEEGKKEIVNRFAPGVVGQQPGLESGDIFIYGSGVFLPTKNGIMKGSFQFNALDGSLFEVPVAPFRLIANQENRK